MHGEHVHNAVHRLHRVHGVQGGEHKVPGFRRRDGKVDGFQVAHFPDQDHVRVLAQHVLERVGKAVGVHIQFALVDERHVVVVHKLGGVFHRHDVNGLGAVDLVDHRRQRGGLP